MQSLNDTKIYSNLVTLFQYLWSRSGQLHKKKVKLKTLIETELQQVNFLKKFRNDLVVPTEAVCNICRVIRNLA